MKKISNLYAQNSDLYSVIFFNILAILIHYFGNPSPIENTLFISLGVFFGITVLYQRMGKWTLGETSIIQKRFLRKKSVKYTDIIHWQTDLSGNLRLLTQEDSLFISRRLLQNPEFMAKLREKVPILSSEDVSLPWQLMDNGRFASWNNGLIKLIFTSEAIIEKRATSEKSWPVNTLQQIYREIVPVKRGVEDNGQVVMLFENNKRLTIRPRKSAAFGYASDRILRLLHQLYPQSNHHNQLSHVEKAQMLIDAGGKYRLEVKLRRAVEAYEQAIAINPDFMAYKIQIGDMYFELGEYDDALWAYRKGLEFAPENQSSWTGYGHCAMKIGNYEEAAQAYEHGLTLGSNNEELLFNAAMALTKLNNHDKAQNHLQQLIDLNPDWLPRIQQNPLLENYIDDLELPDIEDGSWLRKIFPSSSSN